MINTDLKSTIQVNHASSKAFKILGLMKRTFVSRDLQLWKTIYTTYIRPHIEFANSACNPHLRKDIEILEHVQRSATKVPHATRHLQYTERLKLFNITTIEERRTRGHTYRSSSFISDLKLSTGPYHPLFTTIDREEDQIGMPSLTTFWVLRAPSRDC